MFRSACLTVIAVTAFAGAAFVDVAWAQGAPPAKAPAKRTVLQQTDVSTEAPQEVIFGTVEIAPGTGNPFHTHFGTEIGYVVQGHIRVEKKGEPPQDLGPGQSFLIPRGVVHHSIPLGDEPVKLINNWVVDKGKPLLTPAPQ
jgi:quercetin dioxygenase-like cupin family protein